MLPTRRVLLSGAQATPWDQWPMGAWARRVSVLPVTRTITSLPASLWKGDSLGRLLPLWTTTATTELSGAILSPSAVGPRTPAGSPTRRGLALRATRGAPSPAPVGPPPRRPATPEAPPRAASI